MLAILSFPISDLAGHPETDVRHSTTSDGNGRNIRCAWNDENLRSGQPAPGALRDSGVRADLFSAEMKWMANHRVGWDQAFQSMIQLLTHRLLTLEGTGAKGKEQRHEHSPQQH